MNWRRFIQPDRTVPSGTPPTGTGTLAPVAVVADRDGDAIDDALLGYGPDAGDVFTTM